MKNQSWFLPIMTLILLGMVVAAAYYVKNREQKPTSTITRATEMLSVEERKEKTGEEPQGVVVHDKGGTFKMAPISSKPKNFPTEAELREKQKNK